MVLLGNYPPADYDAAGSSSDDSIPNAPPVKKQSPKPTTTALLPNADAPVRPPIKMRRTGQEGMPKSYNDFFDKPPASKPATPASKPAPQAAKPTPPVFASNTPGLEEDIEFITSDVVRRSPRKAPDSTEHTPVPKPRGPGRPPGSGNKSTSTGTEEMPKRKMSEAHKEALRQSLKARWADGSMSHVPDKVRETLKRKSLATSGDDEQPQRKQPKPRQHWSPVTQTQPSGPAHRQDGLWEYIRPYLVQYRDSEIPNKSRIPDLLKMPRRREIEWNKFSRRPFSDTEPKNIGSLLLWLVGDVQAEPCFRCKENRGPFKGCVKLPETTPLRISHCANCWYSHQVCSGEQWIGPKRGSNEDTSTQQQDQAEDEEEYADMADFEDDREEEAAPNGDLEPILRAPSGRLYDDWVDEYGNYISQEGCLLLPDGYELDNKDPLRPWTCPVADCNNPGAFTRRQDLRFHFARKHYAAMLNDNNDGAFEIIGYYDENRVLGNGGTFPSHPPSLPVVVSQSGWKAPGNSDVPSLRPRRAKAAEDAEEEVSRPMSEAAILSAMTPEDARRARAMWDYIRPYLHSTKTIPASGHVKELLPLPRVRDLKWNPNCIQGFVERVPRDVSCMIIQVTGEEAPAPCTECVKGKNPFDGCVVIARDANPDVRSRMISCANCNYHGLQNRCSIKQWVMDREQPEYPPYYNPKAKKAAEKDGETSKVPSPARASRASSFALPALPQPSGSGGGRPVAISRSLRPRQSEPQADAAGTSALISVGQVAAADEMLDMEEWEIAPGRIRSQASDTPDSKLPQPETRLMFTPVNSEADIAMSHAYLGSSRPIQVSNDLSLRIADVRGGTTLRFEAEQDNTRICTIASGKLKVKIDGEPEFIVGPRGMFKIRPGAAATALNTSYFWAAVFITTQMEYA